MYRIFIIIFLLFNLFACAERPEELKIGLIIDSEATNAEESINAAELAVGQLNQQNLALKNERLLRFKLLIKDSGKQAKNAMQVAQQLIYEDSIHAIIGPNSSRAAIPVSLIAERTRVPMISIGASHHDVTLNKSFVFRVTPTDEQQIKLLAEFVGQKRSQMFEHDTDNSPGNVAVLFDKKNIYSRNMSVLFEKELLARNINLMQYQYLTGETDFSRQISSIISAQIDFILLPNFSDDLRHQVKQLADANVKINILGTDSWDFHTPPSQFSELDMFAFSASHPYKFNDNQKSQIFIQQYQRKYKSDVFLGGAFTSDAVYVLAAAVVKAGSLDSEKIHEQLILTDYNGITGKIKFDLQGNAVRHNQVFSISPNGIEPVDF
ncbi:MAG: ABC transporter substrate-binding protein [Kangiellaceae bacterium]|nr:ABC transporter substrate-binding protein [Kangiellaceae bacterium]MCW8998761.1 ABC transporter substrate-binding protein [Kangiellaceae bacterium]MCW9015505.1 ABC transporter substrate-binding protein [Kangiellaceae bacterium]